MKRYCFFLYLLAILFLSCAEEVKQPKYVFYMIGDGMGINQVIGTTLYNGSIGGHIKTKPLVITQFPNTGLAYTYSVTNGITDSSAGGTALSCGVKTGNGVLGMNSTKDKVLTSIAEMARDKGRAVGIVTSVSIDHATPGAFYAHVPNRKMYYTIGTQMAASNFDFFGGADFLSLTDPADSLSLDLHTVLENSGYTILKSYESFLSGKKDHNKIFLTQPDGCGFVQAKKGRASIPYAIDRVSTDLKLEQITNAAVDFLYAKGKGFFLMVEGGEIDWACHSNDGATVFSEVNDFDCAVKLAYDFYCQHPDETLIVVTSDHETGGLALGNDQYELNLDYLACQKVSLAKLSQLISTELSQSDFFSWDQLKIILRENLSFGEQIQLMPNEWDRIRKAYELTINGRAKRVKSEYFEDELIAVVAINILNEKAHCGWTTKQHSAASVGIYAIGVGAERFTGIMENTEIAKRIASIAGYDEQ